MSSSVSPNHEQKQTESKHSEDKKTSQDEVDADEEEELVECRFWSPPELLGFLCLCLAHAAARCKGWFRGCVRVFGCVCDVIVGWGEMGEILPLHTLLCVHALLSSMLFVLYGVSQRWPTLK